MVSPKSGRGLSGIGGETTLLGCLKTAFDTSAFRQLPKDMKMLVLKRLTDEQTLRDY